MKIRYQEVIVARERQTNTPKGFGFIQFASTEDASIFVDRFFPGFELDGRKVFINYSKLETPEMVDWNCTHCEAFNSRKRDTCWQCTSMKPLGRIFDRGCLGLHPSSCTRLVPNGVALPRFVRMIFLVSLDFLRPPV